MGKHDKWSEKDKLKRLPNPDPDGYEIRMEIPELTFMGVKQQPDFGHLTLVFYPADWIIELKALKEYVVAFRSKVISYERLINVIYEDLVAVYEPARLRLVADLRPRGGISSRLVIDSDWGCRGGKEEFGDWKRMEG